MEIVLRNIIREGDLKTETWTSLPTRTIQILYSNMTTKPSLFFLTSQNSKNSRKKI